MEENNELDKVVDEMLEYDIGYINNKLSEIKVISDTTMRIKEKIFKKYLLGFFQDIDHIEDNYPIFINNYSKLAKSFTNNITIVDEDDTELFKLPPLIISAKEIENIVNDVNYVKIVNKFMSIESTNSTDANLYLKDVVGSLGKLMNLPEELVNEYETEFKKMIDRYDLFKTDTKKENIKNNKINSNDDLFDFD